jgi:hypothetical protein
MNVAQCYNPETHRYLPQLSGPHHSHTEGLKAAERLLMTAPVTYVPPRPAAPPEQKGVEARHVDTLLAYIRKNPGCTIYDAVDSLGMHYATVRRCKDQLVNRGVLETGSKPIVGKPGRTSIHTFTVREYKT